MIPTLHPPPQRPGSPQFGGTGLRVLTAIPLLAVAAVMIWVPPLNQAFFALVAVMAGLCAWEYHKLCAAKGLATKQVPGTILAALLSLAPMVYGLTGLTMAFFAATTLLIFLHLVQGSHSLDDFSATIFGLLYTGLFPAFFVLLHLTPLYGPGLVTMLAVAVGLSDTGAYFTGRAIGKRKLAPKVSPNKTWEGSVGGVVLAVVALIGWGVAARHLGWNLAPAWPLWVFAVTGAVLAVVSQIGDLLESMIKRDAGVKDSGAIFPGHGGALDRCDGFLLAGPALYCLLVVFS